MAPQSDKIDIFAHMWYD